MELSLDDLQIVNALQIAPRASWAQLARVLRRHPTTLAQRYERLRAEGRVWVTAHRAVGDGGACFALIDVRVRPGSKAALVARLCALPNVVTIDEGVRDWDLQLTTMTHDYDELAAHVLPLITGDPDVAHTDVSLLTRAFALGHGWRLDTLTGAQRSALTELGAPEPATGAPEPSGFEELVQALARDGRASHAELAAATGLHPTTVARQLRSAFAERRITLRCELAQQDSGHTIGCHWHVRVPADRLTTTHEHLRRHRTLRFSASVTGQSNLMFSMWLRTPADIHRVESELVAAVPEAQVLRTELALRTYKRMGWVLTEDTRASGDVVPW